MRVYRVEHSESKFGPYNHDLYGLGYRMGAAHNEPTRPPWEVWSYNFDDAWRGGFACAKDLLVWFAEWIQEMTEQGFVVRVYSVELENVEEFKEAKGIYTWFFEGADGDPLNQLIFTDGELVEELSLSDLCDMV